MLRKHEWEQGGIQAMEKVFSTCCLPSGDLGWGPLGGNTAVPSLWSQPCSSCGLCPQSPQNGITLLHLTRSWIRPCAQNVAQFLLLRWMHPFASGGNGAEPEQPWASRKFKALWVSVQEPSQMSKRERECTQGQWVWVGGCRNEGGGDFQPRPWWEQRCLKGLALQQPSGWWSPWGFEICP